MRLGSEPRSLENIWGNLCFSGASCPLWALSSGQLDPRGSSEAAFRIQGWKVRNVWTTSSIPWHRCSEDSLCRSTPALTGNQNESRHPLEPCTGREKREACTSFAIIIFWGEESFDFYNGSLATLLESEHEKFSRLPVSSLMANTFDSLKVFWSAPKGEGGKRCGSDLWSLGTILKPKWEKKKKDLVFSFEK